MSYIKKVKRAYLILSAAMVVMGIVLIAFPKISMMTVCCIAGALSIALGIVKLIGYFSDDLFRLAFQFDLAFGVLAVVTGILMLAHPDHVVKVIPMILGIIVMADGAFKLQTSYDAKRFGLRHWGWILILAAATCIFGLLLVIHPVQSAAALTVLTGLTLVMDGIQNLCIVAYTVKESRGVKYRDISDEE